MKGLDHQGAGERNVRAGGRTATIHSYAIDPDAMDPGTICADKPLPWALATPLIGGVSFALWLGIWQLARLALDG